ncbi:hypothetical protein [Mannheimia haemolytica]|nr:hypothetical protein [Mannheimia haemolytica]
MNETYPLEIKSLKYEIERKNYSYLILLKEIFYDIEKCLINRSNDDIKAISIFIDESIDDYFQYELEEAIEKAREAVRNGDFEHNRFFDPPVKLDDYLSAPIEDEIMLAFDVASRENTTDNQALQYILNYFFGNEITDLEDVRDYEVMAVMALKHIQSALQYSDEKYQKENIDSNFVKYGLVDDYLHIAEQNAVEESINACLAINLCQMMKLSEDIFIAVKDNESNILKERAKKGGKARHRETNKLKAQILNEYQQEVRRYKEIGKVLSKNDFARRKAIEYGISETTIRKNWLQGI